MNKMNKYMSYRHLHNLNDYEKLFQNKRYLPEDTTQIQYTFEQIYAILVRFSEKIQIIQDLIFNMTGKVKIPILETWNYFNHFFLEGSYFHYRCQGFVECLKITRAYSSTSMNIWVNQLVYPAAENFKHSMMFFNQLRQNPEITEISELLELEKQLAEFKDIAIIIIEYANRINTISPSITI